ARLEQPAPLRIPDHRGPDSAFDRVGGVAPFDLREDRRARAVADAVEPHERRTPDRLRIVLVPARHQLPPKGRTRASPARHQSIYIAPAPVQAARPQPSPLWIGRRWRDAVAPDEGDRTAHG